MRFARGHAVVCVLAAYHLWQLIFLHRSLRHNLKILNILSGLSPETPTELFACLGVLKEKMGLCVGRAFASEKVHSRLIPSIKVVFSKLVYIKKIFHSCIADLQISKIQIPSFFTLKDAFRQVGIYQTKNVQTMTNKYLKHQALSKQNKNIFIKIVQFLWNLSTQTLREYILPQETECMVFGKFVMETKGISCYEPEIIALNKSAMIRQIANKIKVKKFKAFIVGVLLGLCCVFLALWFKTHIKKFALSNINRLEKLFVKSRLCHYCSESISSVINVKCKHMTLCEKCSQLNQKCTECNNLSEKIHCYV